MDDPEQPLRRLGKDIIVGYSHSGYPSQRNFLSLPHVGIRYRKCLDLFKFPEHLLFRVSGKSAPLLLTSYQDFGLNRSIDCFHFFNGVSFARKPWVSTFETYLPRLGDNERCFASAYVNRLASPACKTLIAISECAADIQRRWLNRHYPNFADAICAKLQVMHPPQAIDPEERRGEERRDGAPIRLLIVGHQFFGKGGPEVLIVINRLLKERRELQLTIVSQMLTDRYATRSTSADVDACRRIIAAWPDSITHYERLPNLEVRKLLHGADVALLPSYAETYGYFVLEAQAAGVPVVTTNIRAFPEINTADCGWVIDLPRDEDGNAILNGVNLDRARAKVESGLNSILEEILASPAMIYQKGRKARERIISDHDPAHAVTRLRRIYEAALG